MLQCELHASVIQNETAPINIGIGDQGQLSNNGCYTYISLI
jgi:hypothetical protein